MLLGVTMPAWVLQSPSLIGIPQTSTVVETGRHPDVVNVSLDDHHAQWTSPSG